MSLVWMLYLPGLAHRLEHGHDGVRTLAALRALGGQLEGEHLVGEGTVDEVLRYVSGEVEGLGVAGVVGPVDSWLDGGVPTGLGAHRLRRALPYARVGEVLALPGVEVPDGVGRFTAPKVIVAAVGCPVEVLRDYR